MEQKLGIIKCYKEAWQSFKVHWKLAIGGMFIYIAIAYPGQIIEYFYEVREMQYFNWLFIIFVMPPLMIGLGILSLNIAGVAEPHLRDMFSGFRIYWKSIGLFLLCMLVVFAISIPLGIILGFLLIGAMFGGEESFVTLLIVIGIISTGIISLLTVRWFLIFNVQADEPETTVVDCLKRSSQITKGNRLRLFGVFLMMFPVILLGLLAFGLGVLVTVPITWIALARAYLWLKSFHPPLNAIATEQIES